MGNDTTLAEIDQRIAIVRDNLRQLTEQATAFSGAADEERIANRISDQEDELQRLLAQRDQMTKKKK
jgi:hypothetical protein